MTYFFTPKVLLAYPVRRELQRGAANVIWRLHSQPACTFLQAHAPAADVVLTQRLAMDCSNSEAGRQARVAEATVEQLWRGLAAMVRLLDAFDVTDEQRSYWWSRDGAHATSRFQRHFGFVLRAGQVARVHLPTFKFLASGIPNARV